MNERIKALQTEAGSLLRQGDEIRERYKGAATMSEEDYASYTQVMEKYDSTMRDIAEEQKDVERRKTLATPISDIVHPRTGEPITNRGNHTAEEVLKAYGDFLRYGTHGMKADSADVLKAYQADNDVQGGYMIAPEQMIAGLLKRLDDEVFIRALATKYQIAKAESLGVVTLEDDVDDPVWTSELATGDEDEGLTLGKRALFPHPLAKQVKISRKLIRQATVDPAQLVLDRLTRKFSVVEENAFQFGDGDEQPLGLFVPSSNGISTARDIVTGQATNYTADALINAHFALKAPYRKNARWLFHRFAIREIRKLKYAEGDYIWQSGIDNGQGPNILNIPITESEFAPHNFSDGQYAGLVGDFSYYWIADALDLTIQVLNELYARSNQIGYIARKETDAMPVMEEAFVRLKFGA